MFVKNTNQLKPATENVTDGTKVALLKTIISTKFIAGFLSFKNYEFILYETPLPVLINK